MPIAAGYFVMWLWYRSADRNIFAYQLQSNYVFQHAISTYACKIISKTFFINILPSHPFLLVGTKSKKGLNKISRVSSEDLFPWPSDKLVLWNESETECGHA